MDKCFDEQLLIMKYSLDANEDKMMKIGFKSTEMKSEFIKMKSEFIKMKTVFKQMMVHNHYYSPDNMDSPKAQDPDTVVLANKKAPQLEGGSYKKNITRSPKFYEILIKT